VLSCNCTDTDSICVVLGYTDTNCGTEIDECSSNPCEGRGNCTDSLNSFSCSCYSGFYQFVVGLEPGNKTDEKYRLR